MKAWLLRWIAYFSLWHKLGLFFPMFLESSVHTKECKIDLNLEYKPGSFSEASRSQTEFSVDFFFCIMNEVLRHLISSCWVALRTLGGRLPSCHSHLRWNTHCVSHQVNHLRWELEAFSQGRGHRYLVDMLRPLANPSEWKQGANGSCCPQPPGQHRHRRHSMIICWISEWMNK
jgi:hypothetical protein